MKEKRIDINLAKAAFYQIIFIGFGGALLNEVIKAEDSKPEVVVASFIGTVAVGFVVRGYYLKATRLSKRSKTKYHADH